MKTLKGFTMIEMVMTLALVGLLTMLAAPLAEVASKRSKETELRMALRQIRGALDDYRQAVKEGRVFIAMDDSGYPPSLETLVDGVTDRTDPNGKKKIYFLRRIPRNPIGDSPDIPAAKTWGKRSYASDASEPEEGRDVYDVYVPSDAVGLNGIAYREW
jgi:general secretion pathway protein G